MDSKFSSSSQYRLNLCSFADTPAMRKFYYVFIYSSTSEESQTTPVKLLLSRPCIITISLRKFMIIGSSSFHCSLLTLNVRGWGNYFYLQHPAVTKTNFWDTALCYFHYSVWNFPVSQTGTLDFLPMSVQQDFLQHYQELWKPYKCSNCPLGKGFTFSCSLPDLATSVRLFTVN